VRVGRPGPLRRSASVTSDAEISTPSIRQWQCAGVHADDGRPGQAADPAVRKGGRIGASAGARVNAGPDGS